MAYTYYNIYKDNIAKTPKQDYSDEMQAFVDDMFYDSSDWYTIQEETSYASGVYSDLDVRINEVFNPSTGINQGDDWKKLIFKDITKSVPIGSMFQFQSNYWITVNTGNLNTLTSSCVVRRCNDTLRWIDGDGARQSIPCVLDYRIQENRDYASSTSSVVNPSGILEVTSQLNSRSNLIRPTQRFLFGNPSNWTSYKVFGGGINNFLKNQTLGTSLEGILKLTLGAIQYNTDGDDLVNGYADVYELNYTIELSKSSISGIATDTYQLDALVKLNGADVSRTVTWSSSDESIATVSSSGLVTFVSTGSTTITAILEENDTVSDTCSVTVDVTPISEYVVVFSPETTSILEGNTESYNVTLELNGATQPDTFTFSVVSSTPTANYNLTAVDGNNFTLENVERYMEEPLTVRATSGVHTKDFDILLKGAW